MVEESVLYLWLQNIGAREIIKVIRYQIFHKGGASSKASSIYTWCQLIYRYFLYPAAGFWNL